MEIYLERLNNMDMDRKNSNYYYLIIIVHIFINNIIIAINYYNYLIIIRIELLINKKRASHSDYFEL